jgi:hypothetical protein
MEGLKTRSRLVYILIGLVLALMLGIYVVFQIPHIVLLFLLTLLFAIVLSGPVNYLAQMGLPRGLGVFVVLESLALAPPPSSLGTALPQVKAVLGMRLAASDSITCIGKGYPRCTSGWKKYGNEQDP